jgi:hypothetical protein
MLEALEVVGHEDDLSIENEDPFLPGVSGMRHAVENGLPDARSLSG